MCFKVSNQMACYIGARNRQNRSNITPQHSAALVVQGVKTIRAAPHHDPFESRLRLELIDAVGGRGRIYFILIHQNFMVLRCQDKFKALNIVQDHDPIATMS